MELLEDDYLGGMGSRGYGKVKFEAVKVWWNRASDYEAGTVELTEPRRVNAGLDTAARVVREFDSLKAKLV